MSSPRRSSAQEGNSWTYEERFIYLLRALVGRDAFHIRFVKRTDGSIREMRCWLRSPDSDRLDLGLVAVWDADKQADRMIPIESITSISWATAAIGPKIDGNYVSERDLRRLDRIYENRYLTKDR